MFPIYYFNPAYFPATYFPESNHAPPLPEGPIIGTRTPEGPIVTSFSSRESATGTLTTPDTKGVIAEGEFGGSLAESTTYSGALFHATVD